MDVLLVEDEDAIRELLEEDLSDAGLVVVPVPNAEEGLDAAAQEAPAVLVTDVNLGAGMDGLELAAEVRRRWPGVAVVVMTGAETNLARMADGLTDACLRKPFRPHRLLETVSRLVNARRQVGASRAVEARGGGAPPP